MKKFTSLLLVFALVCLALTGCTSGGAEEAAAEQEEAVEEPAVEEDALKVGLVVPGSINDGGWSSAAYQGLLLIEEKYNAEVSYMEAKSPSDVVDGFRDYGVRGFDIVFGHSYDYQDAAKRVAPEFMDTVYITSGGDTVMDNVSPIYFEFEQASYLAGVVAAELSKTGKIGAIGSIEMPAITKSLVSYEQGAKDTRGDIKVVVNYLGTQDDIGKAKEMTQAMIDDGVDVFWASANAAGQGCLQAVEENSDKGILIYGAYSKWSVDSPDVVIADLYIDAAQAFSAAADGILGGFEPGQIRVGIEEGVVNFDWNANFLSEEDAVNAYDSAYEKIQAGEIEIQIGSY